MAGDDQTGITEAFRKLSAQSSTYDDYARHRVNICLIGAGTIGLSFAVLHLTANPYAHIRIYDTRPNLEEYVQSTLPNTISTVSDFIDDYGPRLRVETDLATALSDADIVQEQGPENAEFKIKLWPQIEKLVSDTTLLWSSTSGIPASKQSRDMKDRHRLIVVHPYNPPHIMPLVEVVPSPDTPADITDRTLKYWHDIGRAPVLIKKEATGFVANRLAFALFREAISLVHAGIVSMEDVDRIVQNSMGPRWAVAGPFRSYHAGGGAGGLTGFMKNIGGTMKDCWAASEEIKVGPGGTEDGWQDQICQDAEKAFGQVDTEKNHLTTKEVLHVTIETKEKPLHSPTIPGL